MTNAMETEPPGGVDPPGLSALADLEDAIHKAQLVSWETLSSDELVAAADAMMRLTDRVDALRSTVVGALDQSGAWAEAAHRNCGALLRSRHPQRHPTEVRRDVRLADRLRQMPHTSEAFDGGVITRDHVRVLATCLHPRYDDRFADFEEQLVKWAIELPWSEWNRLIARWKDAADRAEADERDRRDQVAREVHLSRTWQDRGALRGTLTPHARNVVANELDRLTELLFQQDWAAAMERHGTAEVTKDMLDRMATQRRHDALVLMAQRSAGAESAADPVAVVHVHCTADELEAALLDATDTRRHRDRRSRAGPLDPAAERPSRVRGRNTHQPPSSRSPRHRRDRETGGVRPQGPSGGCVAGSPSLHPPTASSDRDPRPMVRLRLWPSRPPLRSGSRDRIPRRRPHRRRERPATLPRLAPTQDAVAKSGGDADVALDPRLPGRRGC